jgi:hypothetical protein
MTEDNLSADLSAAWDAQVEAPEAAPVEAPVAEAAPEAPTEAPVSTDRPRDEHGRFAKVEKPTTPAPEMASPEIKPAQGSKDVAPAPSPVERPWLSGVAPPPGWSPAAKFHFEKLPQEVREAIAKREQEMDQGAAKFASYKGLEEYDTLARNSGTTLHEAMGRYVHTERELARDPVNTIVWLAEQYGAMDGLAQFFGGQGQGQQNPEAQALHPVLQKLQTIEEELNSYKQQSEHQKLSAINSQLAAFAADPKHKYFANVEEDMAILMESGKAKDLEDAYQKACRMNDDIYPLLTKEQEERKQAELQRAASDARRAAGSLSNGAPIPGASSGGASSSNLRGVLEDNWNSLTI